MPVIYLGNTSPVGTKGNQVTTVNSNELDEQSTLSVIANLWPNHSSQPPAWVDTNDQNLAEKISELFSSTDHKCKIGKPENWGNN